MLNPILACGVVHSAAPASFQLLYYLSWHHSPSHLLHPHWALHSLEILPGIFFSRFFTFFIPTHPSRLYSSMTSQRRKPLLRFPSLPRLDQVVVFSRSWLGFSSISKFTLSDSTFIRGPSDCLPCPLAWGLGEETCSRGSPGSAQSLQPGGTDYCGKDPLPRPAARALRPSPFALRPGTPLPVGGPIVAVVGEEVEVQLPEDVEGDAAVGGRHVVIGLPEHGVEAVQGHVLTQQPVREPVDLQQPLQLLPERAHGRWGRIRTLHAHTVIWRPPSCGGEALTQPPTADVETGHATTRPSSEDESPAWAEGSCTGALGRLHRPGANPVSPPWVEAGLLAFQSPYWGGRSLRLSATGKQKEGAPAYHQGLYLHRSEVRVTAC